MKFLIIKTGSTFPKIVGELGDFDDWIMGLSGLKPDDAIIVEPVKKQSLPMAANIAGAIITGSHAMVTDNCAWMDHLSQWIALIIEKQIPLLGICFGHQAIAQAMGGQADYHPQGREIGTTAISLTQHASEDVLFRHFPTAFSAHVTHAQTVTRIPNKAILLASNEFEPHHAFRIGQWAWGVQFHPEFSAAAMQAYIDEQSSALLKEGQDIRSLKANVTDTPESNSLIKHFIRLAANKQSGVAT